MTSGREGLSKKKKEQTLETRGQEQRKGVPNTSNRKIQDLMGENWYRDGKPNAGIATRQNKIGGESLNRRKRTSAPGMLASSPLAPTNIEKIAGGEVGKKQKEDVPGSGRNYFGLRS